MMIQAHKRKLAAPPNDQQFIFSGHCQHISTLSIFSFFPCGNQTHVHSQTYIPPFYLHAFFVCRMVLVMNITVSL